MSFCKPNLVLKSFTSSNQVDNVFCHDLILSHDRCMGPIDEAIKPKQAICSYINICNGNTTHMD